MGVEELLRSRALERCGVCGTLGIFANLVTCSEKNGYYTNAWDYVFECLEENECARRQSMRMSA